MSRSENKIIIIKTVVILFTFSMLINGWILWTFVFNSKQNIFESMLANSLSTTSVTKQINESGDVGSLVQSSQAHFGTQNVVEVKTTITQGSGDQQTKVQTRTIGTPTENYSAYEHITIPENESKPNIDEIIGLWGVQLESEGGNGVYSEAIYGAVMFGNLPNQQRAELLNLMDEKLVYVPNYDDVESKEINGRSTYAYPVAMSSGGYAETVRRYDEMLGLNLLSDINPEDYADSPAINLKLYVDKRSRQLVRVEYSDGGRAENYTAYGIKKQVDIPENYISRSELESKLQLILN